MGCSDGKVKVWSKIKKGSTYTLSVAAPEDSQITAFAEYYQNQAALMAGKPTEVWRDILPGPHHKDLNTDDTDFVLVFVAFQPDQHIIVSVKADITGQPATYCRAISSTTSAVGAITHVLGMA